MENNDLTGKRFGYITVIKLNHTNYRGCSWLCKCDCGKEIVLSNCSLVSTKRRPNRSCGCKNKRQNGNTIKYKRLYSDWKNMVHRCYDSKNGSYERYGGEGVSVCEEWRTSFDNFLSWALDNEYADELTLDRIDSEQPYSPDNCRWVDYFVQAQNRKTFKNNKVGHTGVCAYKGGKFRAYIRRNGIKRELGIFDTLDSAIEARKKAELEMA